MIGSIFSTQIKPTNTSSLPGSSLFQSLPLPNMVIFLPCTSRFQLHNIHIYVRNIHVIKPHVLTFELFSIYIGYNGSEALVSMTHEVHFLFISQYFRGYFQSIHTYFIQVDILYLHIMLQLLYILFFSINSSCLIIQIIMK